MRQLVTIQKIRDIQPIPGRDRVEKAKVLGYDVIIGKDTFKNGDLVAFAEIDTILPLEFFPEMEKFKGRIKTFKVNSHEGPIFGQGYVFSLIQFFDIFKLNDLSYYEDVMFGIKKIS